MSHGGANALPQRHVRHQGLTAPCVNTGCSNGGSCSTATAKALTQGRENAISAKNSEVGFWATPEEKRKILTWELFTSHFANRPAMDWVWMLEDIQFRGHRHRLERTYADD